MAVIMSSFLKRVCVDERFGPLSPLGTTLDASQVSRFHDAMAEARHSKEQRTWESRQPCVHAFNEDAAVTGPWLGAGAIEPP